MYFLVCYSQFSVYHLQHPGKKASRAWEIPAKLRVKFWFGKKKFEDQWSKLQTDDVVVMAETVSIHIVMLT